MLQPMRIEVRCYPIKKSKGYIFVQDKLQRLELEPKLYPKALERSEKTKKFFDDVLKLDNVEVFQNPTTDEVSKTFDDIVKEAEEFEEQNKDDYQAVFGVYAVWIGFWVDLDETDQFSQNIDEKDRNRIWPKHF